MNGVFCRMQHYVCRAAVAVAAAVYLSGCSSPAVDRAVGVGGESRIVVEHSGSAVIVHNQAGRPVLNVRITVEPNDGAAFVHVLPTLDAGAKRELQFAEFRNEDGALLDPAMGTPKQITLTARDTLNNPYDATVPW